MRPQDEYAYMSPEQARVVLARSRAPRRPRAHTVLLYVIAAALVAVAVYHFFL